MSTASLSESLLRSTPHTGIIETLRMPSVATWLLASFCWDLGRSAFIFFGPYYVNGVTEDASLVGVTGAASWSLLLAGPWLGRLSDGCDRRRLMCGYMAFMALVAALGSVRVPWAAMAALMVLLSLCNTLDMTTRMPYLADLCHPEAVGRLVAMRTVLYNVARVCGPQLVGLAPRRAPLAAAALFALGAACSARLPPLRPPTGRAAAPWRRGPAFTSVFGVTVLANLCYWSHQPLIPVLGALLGASPWGVGLLGSASFAGALPVSLLLALEPPRRTGLVYCMGIILADAALVGATLPVYSEVLSSLVLAGACASLFGTVQSAMVMSMAPAESRGRAMGLLTLAIGAGPLGMLLLGELSARIGAPLALRGAAVAGVIAQSLWLWARPEALHVGSHS